MKMSPERYNLLKAACKAVVEHFGPDKWRDLGKRTNTVSMMWLLHNRATDQLQYPDTHPLFQNGKWVRCTPHVEGFQIYDDNGTSLHDDHIATALRKIVKELELVGHRQESKQPLTEISDAATLR